jgi:hypothetical protein
MSVRTQKKKEMEGERKRHPVIGWFARPATLASLSNARLASWGEQFWLACVREGNSGERENRGRKQMNQTVGRPCLVRKNFQDSPSHRIFGRMHGVLNKDNNKN